jgi:hypothetical protein
LSSVEELFSTTDDDSVGFWTVVSVFLSGETELEEELDELEEEELERFRVLRDECDRDLFLPLDLDSERSLEFERYLLLFTRSLDRDLESSRRRLFLTCPRDLDADRDLDLDLVGEFLSELRWSSGGELLLVTNLPRLF